RSQAVTVHRWSPSPVAASGPGPTAAVGPVPSGEFALARRRAGPAGHGQDGPLRSRRGEGGEDASRAQTLDLEGEDRGAGPLLGSLAPATGLEPVTCRLTAGRSAN